MLSKLITTLAFASSAFAAAISITPHTQYGSSVGVLGCLIDTNRVAYWPREPGCDSVCVKVTEPSSGRTVNLLAIDTSGSAFDISYDAWNYLYTGKGAKEAPVMGGGVPADWESLPMSECASLIKTPDGKLPIMAANSINYFMGCPADSWIRKNAALYNIQNAVCTLGFNEVCHLDMAISNQPSCAHILGAQNPLSGLQVVNIDYGTGAESFAL
jgi:hypothetical protein